MNQRRLLEALRASPAMLFEQDLDLRITSVLNPLPPWTEERVVGKTTFELLPHEQAAEVTRVEREVMAAGQGTSLTMRLAHGDQDHEYTLTIEPKRNEHGVVVGIVCLAWDVTRERAMDQVMQNSRAQLCSFVTEAPTSVALLDRDLRYIAVSRSWIREMGRGHTEFIGRDHYELWPDCLEEWKENHRLALTGHYMYREEDLWVRPDGTKLWTRWAVYPWRDFVGEIGGIVLAIDDISERKRAEEALKESEERFRMMAETVPDSLFITRADGYSEYINEQYLKVTGLEAGTTRGDGWADAVHPEDRPRIMRAWNTAVETGEPYAERLRLVHLQTGTTRWYLARAVPIRDNEGRIVRWFGCTTDIEDQVREAALRDTDRRKNEFLAMLSHELRNPLAAIRSATCLLQNTPSTPPTVDQAREVIDRQVTHLTRIVDDLLDIARIVRGKFSLDWKRFELGEVVRRCVEDHRAEFENRNIDLECWLGAKELWVDGDETRLVQVIDNLLSNALKFTPERGSVAVFLKNEKGNVVLRVRDSGIGIASEHLRDLFEPFVQFGSTIDRSQGGLGLGLTLVKGVIEMHGGKVRVESRGNGHGSEFIIELPLRTPNVAFPEPKKGRVLRRRSVLLVEDNVDMAGLLRQLLELLGQEVHVASDGLKGFELAQTVHPDLVICDIGLPGMSGLEFARKISADGQLRAIELVALSGYGLPEDRKKSAAAGFSKHLVKPVSMEDIEALLMIEP